MDVAADNFAFALVRAWQTLGSLLDVAQLLGVEPKQIYLWIADVEAPTAEQRSELEDKLRHLAAAP